MMKDELINENDRVCNRFVNLDKMFNMLRNVLDKL